MAARKSSRSRGRKAGPRTRRQTVLRVLGITAALGLLVALMAALVPASRAMRIDPALTLRAE